jgi:hypothetical protein
LPALTGIGLGGQLQRHRFAVAGNLRKWELVLIFFPPLTFESMRWQQYLGLSLLDVDCYPARGVGSFATMFCGVGLQNAAFQRIVVVPSQYLAIV